MAYLVFATREGEEIGRRALDGPAVIGRSPECDIALTDNLLSRRHCRLMQSFEGWVLSDLDSRNGTMFRGHKIARHVLKDGQVFQIGLINVIFRAGDLVDAKQDGLARPKRPANPMEAPSKTVTHFRYEPRPASPRDAELFPTPIPIDPELQLDWLDVPGGLSPDHK